MNDEQKRYLVEILLRARDEISNVAGRALQSIDKVTDANKTGAEATTAATKADKDRRSELERLHEAHVREKKDLDASSAARRTEASAIRDQTKGLRDQLGEARRNQQENINQAKVLQQLAIAREATVGKIDNETKALNRQSASYVRASEQNRRLADSIQRQVVSLDRQASALDRDARSMESQSRSTTRLIGQIDKQVESVRKSEQALSGLTAERQRADKALEDSIRSTARETDAIVKQSQTMREHNRAISETVSGYVSFVEGLDGSTKSVDENRESLRRFQTDFQRISRQFDSGSDGATHFANAARDAGDRIKDLDHEGSRLAGSGGGGGRIRNFFTEVTGGADRSGKSLRGLNADFRGFQIALIIKYAQSLISVFVALAGTLVSVASAAVQAGAALAGAFAAGAAQALPIVGVLVAAAARLTEVLKAVKLRNQEQLTASQDAQQAAQAQRTASEQIASAEQSEADAHRAVQDAQESLTQARKDAIRTVEDLVTAQRTARQEATAANLSLEQAQIRLQEALRTGASAEDVASLQNDRSSASTGAGVAKRNVTRADQDVAALGGKGVEGTQQVVAARKALADAIRNEGRAEADAARTRRDAAEQLDNETSAANKLQDSLKLLSPAERQLYERILKLQDLYKKASQPITDIIIASFSRVVDRIIGVLQDSKILSSLKSLAGGIAQAIDKVSSLGSSGDSKSFLVGIINEARQNLPTVVDIFSKLFTVAKRFVDAALPAFRDLLGYVDGYATSAERATRKTDGLREFFKTGIRYANAFFKLGLAVVQLFLSLGGAGGAASEGSKTIDDLTDRVRGATKYVQTHTEQVQDFFRKAREGFKEVLGVVIAVGKEVVGLFSLSSIKSFADFLTRVVIPAVGNVVQVMGALVTVFHQLLSLPIASQVAQFALTFLLLAKGMTILKVAVEALKGIIVDMLAAFGALDAVALESGGFFAALTPAGWIILGVTALIALVVLLDKKFHFLGPTLKWLKGAFKDTVDFIVKAAESVADYFQEVWQHGLLAWLKYPIEHFGKYLPQVVVFRFLISHAGDVIDFFKDHWKTIYELAKAPFDLIVKFMKPYWDVLSGFVRIGLDIIKGDFGDAATAIEGVFTSVFNDIYDIVRTILNAIIDGVNVAISGINEISPFHDVPKLKSIPSREDRQVAKALNTHQENLGPTGHLARGGMVPARPGGTRYEIGEEGYDEVVLTTDPKHKRRSQQLLAEYVSRAPHVMRYAKGGWTRGSLQLPTDFTPTHQTSGLPGFGAIDVFGKPGRTVGSPIAGSVSKLSGRPPSAGAYEGQGGPFGYSVYVSGGGRVYFLTHFGSRAVQLGQPVHKGQDLGTIGDYPGPTPDHIHEGLNQGGGSGLVGARSSGSAGTSGLPSSSAPALSTINRILVASNPLKTIKGPLAQGLYGVYDYAKRVVSSLYDTAVGSTTTGSAGVGHGAAGNAQVRRWATEALRYTHHFSANNLSLLVGRIMQESGGDPNITQQVQDVNSEHGDPATGLAQVIGSTFATYRDKRLPNDRRNPIANLVAAIRYMFARYDHVVGASSSGYAHGTSGAEAGWKWVGERGPELVRFRGGEQVLDHSTSKLIDSSTAYGGYATGTTSSKGVDVLVNAVAGLLGDVQVGRISNLMSRFRKAFAQLTDDGGVFDQITDLVSSISTDVTSHLQRLQFSGGSGRKLLSTSGTIAALGGRTGLGLSDLALQGAESSRQDVGSLRSQRGALEQLASSQSQALGVAQEALAVAQARKDKASIAQVQAEVKLLRTKAAATSAALAQNAQDLVEGQETFQQSLLDAVTGQADRLNSQIDRAKRVATALGRDLDPVAVIGQQFAVADNEIQALKRVQANAAKTGNQALVQTIQDQIDELGTQLNELVAQAFQARVDTVNSVASDALSSNDRAQTIAQIGKTNYTALGNALNSRGTILSNQRSGLSDLLGEATRSGNIDQIKILTNQIADLDVSIAQNTQSINDNTDANFDNTTALVSGKSDFQTGVLGSAGQFFQSLGTLTGVDTTGQQRSVLQTTGSVLGTARSGFLGQLSSLLGPGYQGITSLQGSDLVNFLTTIATGPMFDSIIARLDPTQQQSFQGLVTSLLTNTQAIESNTQSLNDLSGVVDQGFSSTAWQRFRLAVFNGSGGLLPQYQMSLPSAAVGAHVMQGGVIRVHDGEDIVPANVVSGAGGWNGGDTTYDIDVNVTSPTEVADPVDFGRQMAHSLKHRPR